MTSGHYEAIATYYPRLFTAGVCWALDLFLRSVSRLWHSAPSSPFTRPGSPEDEQQHRFPASTPGTRFLGARRGFDPPSSPERGSSHHRPLPRRYARGRRLSAPPSRSHRRRLARRWRQTSAAGTDPAHASARTRPQPLTEPGGGCRFSHPPPLRPPPEQRQPREEEEAAAERGAPSDSSARR